MAHVDLQDDPAAVRRIFRSLGLARDDEDVVAHALAGGVSSGIYRVDLASGRYCIKQALPRLKVAKEWRVPVERVFSEIAYLRVVDRIAPGRVPRVLGEDPATKSFVMPFLGDDFRNWKACLLAADVDAGVAAQVGRLLGTIHAATADDARIAGRFANDADFHAIRLEPYLVETARMHPALAARLHATVDVTAGTRRVLVHGDVSPKNILVGPDGPVLLDAECAWFGDPAFDVAFCANHFLLKAAHMPQHASTLLGALRSFWDAYRSHVRWEPAGQLEQRLARLLPALALARVEGKSPVEYLAADARGRVREAAVGLAGQDGLSLKDIASAWMERFAA